MNSIENMLDEMKRKLEDTKKTAARSRSASNDARLTVLPMMDDMLAILREISKKLD